MCTKQSVYLLTTRKLKIQFAEVDKAFAGALIFKGTISAGYSQVIPSQPTAKNVLKTKSRAMTAMDGPRGGLSPPVSDAEPARAAIVAAWPAAPKSINFRRPTRSTR